MPKQYLSAGTVVEDVNTGCRGCATGAGGNKNIFGNKYGQYLGHIQVIRDSRVALELRPRGDPINIDLSTGSHRVA